MSAILCGLWAVLLSVQSGYLVSDQFAGVYDLGPFNSSDTWGTLSHMGRHAVDVNHAHESPSWICGLLHAHRCL